MPELRQGGIRLSFACNGLVPEDPRHNDTIHTTDLTSVFTGGVPICTDEWCSHHEQDMTFLGWAPED